jgi:hypothetical protein
MKLFFKIAILLLGNTYMTSAQNVPSYVPTNGLVGWWPFNGNANDVSGNGNNGTVNGATQTIDRFGQTNHSYYFNGTNFNHIEVLNNPNNSLNLTNNLTISCWFQSDSMYTESGTVRSILMKTGDGVGAQNGYVFGLWGGVPGTGPTVGMVHFAAQPYNNGSSFPGANGFVNIKTWYHLAVTYTDSDSTLKYYLNGNLIDTKRLNFNIGNNSNPLWIGSSQSIYSTKKTFHGKIDDIGIWNRALSQDEISVLHKSCADSIITQPLNQNVTKGSNSSLTVTITDTSYNYQWQTNPIGCGWQNIPNANQYNGANTKTLRVNNLNLSNHGQQLRVITSKLGCTDTSDVAKITISNVISDSLNLVALKSDTTQKGIRIRQLENELVNKHDTLYVGSNITTDTLKISIRTGLSESSPILNNIKVYPNPAANVLNIQLEKPGNYIARLTGITGQTVVSPTSGTIDISSLANGVYILTIHDSNNKLISTNKILIVK